MDLFNDIGKQVGSENKEHLKQLWSKHQWDGAVGADAIRLCNAYIKGALKARITRNADASLTLPE